MPSNAIIIIVVIVVILVTRRSVSDEIQDVHNYLIALQNIVIHLTRKKRKINGFIELCILKWDERVAINLYFT